MVRDDSSPDPFGSDAPPSVRVIEAVAWLQGVGSTALTPLQRTVDVAALNALFDAARRPYPEVRFEYEGYDVAVTGERPVTVRDIDAPGGGDLAPGTNVLVLAPTDCGHDEAACNALLTAAVPGADASDAHATGTAEATAGFERTNVLGVDLDPEGTDPLDRWDFEPGDPAETTLITVEGFTRSSATQAVGNLPDGDRSGGDHSAPIRVDPVVGPGELQSIGMQINRWISAWEDSDRQSVVCFHSVSDVLEVADLERVFRFLHLLTGWLSSKGAVAHFHLDPRAHDEQTINTLRPLFDGSFEIEGNGTWTLHLP
ncbi:DUF7504 family protein [Halobellus sp. GM3]|uniref:DUF7504 family protein n=1 Tax=Halobellus sp. GM3 TaxID=3458410 RepID=UPI00403E2B19